MTRRTARVAAATGSLRRVRLRLTAWYVGTLFVILLLLGVGLFATITARFDRELDESLVQDSHELARVAIARDRIAGPASHTVIVDSTTDLHIPERRLYLLDTLGRSTADKRAAAPWLRDIARAAVLRDSASGTLAVNEDLILRAHAESFTVDGGATLIAVAVADEVELEDRYASLIAVFGLGALAAVVLVAAGGWLLARKSTAPVEEAFAHMRRFMADAAHELRTPLTILRGRAEVSLQRQRGAADYAAALGEIERDAARLGHIVEDLLMLARADAGERPIERKRVYLDDVTLDAANAARVIANRKSVRLEVDDFEESPIEGDEMLLRQLVLILLDNAIKFTAVGGVVRVAVSARSSLATLTVTDTGSGIPPEHLPHVFDRFFRGDPSRTRDARGMSEGAGLGLSIARWVADEHGAKIRIESPVGNASGDIAGGTRVVVEFPAALGVEGDRVSS
ncbi:MAG TPA: HAMP domain-containing sensor histidine kinase [Gemmatimonadaceae bacterium]|jgi:signal transduction histidine kinase|nr:HAMP domain-containing sensor histidine kinase [Gemmatimonadaceae bacterium]